MFGKAFISLALADLALRTMSFERLLARIEGRAGVATVPSLPELRRAYSYTRWIDLAAQRHVVRAQCLQRSLVLHQWLRAEGLPSILRIGVRKADHGLSAHAWVELDGVVINDRPEKVAGFVPLSRAQMSIRNQLVETARW